MVHGRCEFVDTSITGGITTSSFIRDDVVEKKSARAREKKNGIHSSLSIVILFELLIKLSRACGMSDNEASENKNVEIKKWLLLFPPTILSTPPPNFEESVNVGMKKNRIAILWLTECDVTLWFLKYLKLPKTKPKPVNFSHVLFFFALCRRQRQRPVFLSYFFVLFQFIFRVMCKKELFILVTVLPYTSCSLSSSSSSYPNHKELCSCGWWMIEKNNKLSIFYGKHKGIFGVQLMIATQTQTSDSNKYNYTLFPPLISNDFVRWLLTLRVFFLVGEKRKKRNLNFFSSFFSRSKK